MTQRKVALVTGGSGGIGAAICERLAQANLHVIVHSNSNPDKAATVVDTISAKGGSAESVVFDITDDSDVRAKLSAISEQHTIQVLVHNAGIHQDAPMAGMQATQWQQVLDVNLTGFYNVTQPLLLPMMATRWGRVITVSSIAGVTGNRGQANYAASKAGLIAAGKSLAQEIGSRNITVNSVVPGVIDTAMSDGQFGKDFIRQIPLRRAGLPMEVANVVNFLATDEASYIHSQSIIVDGGLS